MGDDGVGQYSEALPEVSGHIGEPYASAIWPPLPVPVVRTAGFIIGVTFLVVLVLAIHPWTFGSTTSPSASVQYDNVVGAGDSTTNYSGGGYSTTVDTPTESSYATTSSGDPNAEAAAVTAILDRTKSDRASVVAAVTDAAACGSNLAGDVQALQNSESDRQSLAQSATALNVDALNGASSVPQELSTALTDSATADGDFATWVIDLEQSCSIGTATQDLNYQAAEGASKTAHQDKQTFLNTWNPIAQQYGQETLSASDI
jgi:hypothetical protein